MVLIICLCYGLPRSKSITSTAPHNYQPNPYLHDATLEITSLVHRLEHSILPSESQARHTIHSYCGISRNSVLCISSPFIDAQVANNLAATSTALIANALRSLRVTASTHTPPSYIDDLVTSTALGYDARPFPTSGRRPGSTFPF